MRSLHAFLLAAVALSAVAAAYDARKGEIPNSLTLGPLALALHEKTVENNFPQCLRDA